MNFKEMVLKELGIELSDYQLQQFSKYYELLITWNEKINLTAITNKEDVEVKHFLDSLTLSKIINLDHKMLCDVGSGAGFPAIPLKIVFPSLEIVMVDSLGKRVNFLNEVIKALDLSRITAVHARVEDFTIENREAFDIVTARAVARLNVLIELCGALVKVDGAFIAMKAQSGMNELEDAKYAIKALGFIQGDVLDFRLPIEDSSRIIIKCDKQKVTNKIYPRMYSKIKNKPL